MLLTAAVSDGRLSSSLKKYTNAKISVLSYNVTIEEADKQEHRGVVGR